MFVDSMLLEDPSLLEDISSIRKDYAYYHPSREEIFQGTFDNGQASLKFTSYLVDVLGFKVTEAVDLFAGRMMDLYADTRLFIASGHTPAELEQMEHQEDS